MDEPEAVPELEAPEWIDKWLAKRASITKRKRPFKTTAEGEEPSAEQLKTAREATGSGETGLEQLDLWLSDLVRNGLGSIGQKSDRIWQDEAAQWSMPRPLAWHHAYVVWQRSPMHLPIGLNDSWLSSVNCNCSLKHSATSNSSIQHYKRDRQMIGWSRKEADVSQLGERVRDRWLFLGQREESIDQGYTQRTWLQGHTTRRIAMLNQFRTAQQSFPKAYPIGREADATLVTGQVHYHNVHS